MKKLAVIAAGICLFAACKESKKDLITGKWQAISVESPELTQQVEASRIFFDTVGTTTDAAANEQLYGVRNMDSMRAVLKLQLDSFLAMQDATVRNTWMNFDKNGTVVASFNSYPDTVKWYFDDEDNLMLDELEQKGAGTKIKMEVVRLEDTILQLKFKEGEFSSTATFKPVK